jgi:hypothetical protein
MVVGEVGVAIVRYFMCYVVAFQNPLRPRRSGEAYGTGSITADDRDSNSISYPLQREMMNLCHISIYIYRLSQSALVPLRICLLCEAGCKYLPTYPHVPENASF